MRGPECASTKKTRTTGEAVFFIDPQNRALLQRKASRYDGMASGGLLGGINVYSYANQNPLSYTDPQGLEATFGDILGAGIRGGVKGASRGSRTGNPYMAGAAAVIGAGYEIYKECKDDDDCKDPLSDWEWKRLLRKYGAEAHPEKIKEDIMGGSVRLYDLCKCKDGSIVVRRKGCTGESQPTDYNLNDL